MSTDPKETISIENIVASSDIGQELDLAELAADLSDTQYDEARFPGIIYRPETVEASVLMFRSGKIVSTGANNREAVRHAFETVFTELTDLGVDGHADPDYEVQNVVFTADLGMNLNLNALAVGLGLEHTEYEPEQFPGLIYRADDLPVVVLFFGTGKLVLTGATERAEVEQAVDEIDSRLHELGLRTA